MASSEEKIYFEDKSAEDLGENEFKNLDVVAESGIFEDSVSKGLKESTCTVVFGGGKISS